MFYYQLGHPGAVVNVDRNGGWVGDLSGFPDVNYTASSKRLDDLDAEIKQLRKAVEELNKTLKDKK